MSPCRVSSHVLYEHCEWHETEMANLTYPLMRSLPQVVFTAAFLKYPTPAVVCSRILSAALELCSSVLPPNLVKRELDFSATLSLDFLNSQRGSFEFWHLVLLVASALSRWFWTVSDYWQHFVYYDSFSLLTTFW